MIASSYITQAEALEWFQKTCAEAEINAYRALSIQDQQAAIMRAMLAIDRLRFKGRRVDATQTEAFPRVIDGVDVGIPKEVKLAVALQALSEGTKSLDNAKLQQLASSGVTSYSIDDFSVSFGGDKKNMSIAQRNGVCEATWQLLEPYLLVGGPVYVL